MQNRPPGDAMAAGYPQGVRVADQREPRGAALATARGSASATARRPGAQRGSEGPSNALAPRHDAGGSVVPSLRGASSSPTPIALTRTERVPPSSSATDTAIVVCRRRRPTRIGRPRRSSAHAGSSPTSDSLAYGQPPPGAGAEATTTWPAVWSNMLVGPLHWLAAMKSVSRPGPPSAQAKHPRSS